MLKQYALITGASSGLGRAFAYELARKKINLILVSLKEEGLPELSDELVKQDIDVRFYETDLVIPENMIRMTEWVNQHFSVFMLINNAGIGGSRRFAEVDFNYLNRIIQLNVLATTAVTHALLPNLLQQEKGYILNVSSMAAFSPMGYKTVYPASKAFIHHFTRGLYQELRHTNVFVSVINPGPMKTNKEVSMRIDRQGVLARLGLLSPEKVAEIAIRQLYKRDTLIMPGIGNGINWLLMKIIPIWIRLPLLTRQIKRELKPENC